MSFYKNLVKFNNKIQKVCEISAVGLLVAILSLLLLQIIARHLNLALAWTGQVGQYLLVLSVFVCAPILFRTEEDISFRPLLKKMEYQNKRKVYLFGNFLIIIFLLFAMTSAIIASTSSLNRGLSSVNWIKVGYAHIFIAIMFFFTMLNVIEETILLWNKNKSELEMNQSTQYMNKTAEEIND